MKHKISFVIFFFSVLLCLAQSKLDIASAEVSFTFINNDVQGTLSGFSSESILDFDQIENTKLNGSVKVSSINTGNSIRNWSLRRSKYFDADIYPKISFESSSVKQEGNTIKVTGNLSIKDIRKEIVFSFEKKENQLIGTTTIYSSDFGISIKSDREKNKVLVKLILQLN